MEIPPAMFQSVTGNSDRRGQMAHTLLPRYGTKEQKTGQDSNSNCSPEYKEEWSLLINLERTFILELYSLRIQFEIHSHGYRQVQEFDVQLNKPDRK